MAGARRVEVWAIVRYDPGFIDPEYMVTVKEILPTYEEAMSEVARLQGLPEKPNTATYFALYSRYYPDGRHVGRRDE